MKDRAGRNDECPHCAADMHACKNCEFYDTSSHNDCREPVAEYVADKERGNFCDMFSPFQGERTGTKQRSAGGQGKARSAV